MKKILNYILLIVSISVTSLILINNKDVSNFPELIISTNKHFLLLAFLTMVFYWICDSYIIYKMKATLGIKGNFSSSFKLSMIGQYYSAITPFATGGQPAQIYSLVNDDVEIGVASSILITKFLIYQFVVTFYSILVFVFKFNFLVKQTITVLPFVIIGCIVNFLVLLTVVGFLYNKKLVEKIFSQLFTLGHKLKLVKDIEKSENKLNINLKDYETSINRMKIDKKTTSILILVTFLQLTLYFSIAYFVYLSFNVQGVTYLDIIALQSIHYIAVSFMPTPGSTGAAEAGFYILYNNIFPKATITFAMLLWRFIDYYFTIIIGGLVTLFDFIHGKSKKVKMVKGKS